MASRDFSQVILEHIFLVVVAVITAMFVGIPTGIFATRYPWMKRPLFAFINVVQTIPSLALFGLLIPLLGQFGIGKVPALIALFLYSLLPIIQNTVIGISQIDPILKEGAIAMGMTDWQLLTQLEIPLSLGAIFGGIRIATVIAVGTATIAAAIGAGGLGTYIFRGLRSNDNALILMGAIPAALIALIADLILGYVEQLFQPRNFSTLMTKRFTLKHVVIVIILLVSWFFGFYVKNFTQKSKEHLVIASKDFTEQVILGELLAQLVEKHSSIPVERRFELGGTLCYRGMTAGNIDAYVEYTGTAYTSVLHHPPISDAHRVYEITKKEFADHFGVDWLSPLGFNNTFAILVRQSDAEKWKLENISDLSRLSSQLRGGFGQDFMSREDGYAGFVKMYDLHFLEVPREMDLSLTYRALAQKEVDLIAGNSTDGMIKKLGLFQLKDDRHYFPPYEAAPLVRQQVLVHHPELSNILNKLSGKISNKMMQEMNYEVDELHHSPREVAQEFLIRTKL